MYKILSMIVLSQLLVTASFADDLQKRYMDACLKDEADCSKRPNCASKRLGDAKSYSAEASCACQFKNLDLIEDKRKIIVMSGNSEVIAFNFTAELNGKPVNYVEKFGRFTGKVVPSCETNSSFLVSDVPQAKQALDELNAITLKQRSNVPTPPKRPAQVVPASDNGGATSAPVQPIDM